MTIKSDDLIILKAERMTQFDNGGGKVTGLQLQNNKSNEVFADVTAIDRVAGRIDYGKLFAAVKTYGDEMKDENGQVINGADGLPIIVPETLQSAGVIITKNPEDVNIGALLFATASHYDEVKDIKSKIESYSIKTVRISGELVGIQPEGSKMLRLAQQLSAQPPKAGDTICIIQSENTTAQKEQYLKVEKVAINPQEVMVKVGNDLRPMTLNIIDISLYYPLTMNFQGGEITGSDSTANNAYLRAAQTNDATSYKGAQSLTEPTVIGDLRVKVKSVYGQLAPPSEGQTNVVDMQAGTDSTPLVASGGSTSFVVSQNIGQGAQLFCGIGILPNTLKINYSGGVLVDVGGQLMAGETPVGTLNYGRGLVMFSISSPIYSGSKNVTFEVATMPPGAISQTDIIQIGESNRGDSYNINLFPTPEPGATTVDYIAMGNRYRLKDRGDGILESDGAGVGSIDYRTGSVSVTLAAAPDANSAIIFSYGTKTDYVNRAKDIQDGKISQDDLKLSIKKQLKGKQLLRGGVSLKWKDNGVDKSALDDGNGKFDTADLKGEINYITGDINLMFVKSVSKGLIINAIYSQAGKDDQYTDGLSGYAVTGDTQEIQLEETNLRPRSVRIEFNIQAQSKTAAKDVLLNTAVVVVNDKDGDGKLYTGDGSAAGTIDYNTGLVRLIVAQRATFWIPIYKWRLSNGNVNESQKTYGYYIDRWEYQTLDGRPPSDGTQYIDLSYAVVGVDAEESEELSADNYTLNLSPTFSEYIVPGSVKFNFSGRNYYDVDGSIYADMDPVTGAGTFSGMVNYQNGEVTLLNWNSGTGNNIGVVSLLTMLNYMPVSNIDWIIPAAPIRPGSLMIRATREDGVRLEATAGENGEIKAASMEGSVDNRTGIVSVNFGAWVDVAGNEGEEWFDPANIKGSKVWQPYLVMIETIKYNVVATSFSPIDPAILGISLVRLPIDGRVPIYKNGDLVVLHETLTQLMPLNVPIDHVVTFGVQLVSELYVEDQDGKRVDCAKFEFNKITGEIKIIDNDFSGYKQPLTGFALIEEENSITDVQITGVVSLRKPIKHKFTEAALLSGLMYIGNMQARYNTLFEQSNWSTSDWSDIGGAKPNWRYNDTEYPIKLTNADTVQERWALLFDSAGGFKIYGENLGLVGTGSTAGDCKPINPNTGAPYFTLSSLGWGQGGQAAGNVLRFNTLAANQPFWLTRSVIPSDDNGKGDSFNFRFRGFKTRDN